MELKIGDLGLPTKLEFYGGKKRAICEKPNYIVKLWILMIIKAPEILDGETGHSYKVDVWSLVVIIYSLLIGKSPFENSDVMTTYKKIRMNGYSFPEHVMISEACKNLITKILVLDSSKSPNLE
jgi:polo-like kinase 1